MSECWRLKARLIRQHSCEAQQHCREYSRGSNDSARCPPTINCEPKGDGRTPKDLFDDLRVYPLYGYRIVGSNPTLSAS